MNVAAIAGQVRERLRHECRAHAVLFGYRLCHVLEEGVPVCGHESVVKVPIHLELAVSVLVVALIGLPSQLQHAIADLADDVVPAHEGRLVVAGFRLPVRSVTDIAALGSDEEEFTLHSAFELHALFGCFGDQTLQRIARRLPDGLAAHPGIGGQPRNFRFPGQLDETSRVGHRKNIGIGRCHVEPGRETGKSGSGLHHLRDSRGRHEFRPQRTEQIRIGDEKILDTAFFGNCC